MQSNVGKQIAGRNLKRILEYQINIVKINMGEYKYSIYHNIIFIMIYPMKQKKILIYS